MKAIIISDPPDVRPYSQCQLVAEAWFAPDLFSQTVPKTLGAVSLAASGTPFGAAVPFCYVAHDTCYEEELQTETLSSSAVCDLWIPAGY